jgi:hypothetical protein
LKGLSEKADDFLSKFRTAARESGEDVQSKIPEARFL